MASPAVARPFTLIERISLWLSAVCMIGMVVLILAEVVLRGAFNSTTEHSDELVGYLLVGVSFFSLALCQGTGAFHKVDMVQMRLGPRGKAVSATFEESSGARASRESRRRRQGCQRFGPSRAEKEENASQHGSR